MTRTGTRETMTTNQPRKAEPMTKISQMRNTETGELSPKHVVGVDDDGRTIVQFVEGWEPADDGGNSIDPEAVECDSDGNYLTD